jgi:transposase
MRPIRRALELLAEKNHSIRYIAGVCGVSRSAINEYQVRADQAGLVWPLPTDMSDAALESRLFRSKAVVSQFPEPDWAEIYRQMRAIKGANLQVFHAEYLIEHPDGMKYSTFCEKYRSFAKKNAPTMRFVFGPGEAAMVDYAGRTITVSAPEPFEAQIFVGVLGASGLIFVDATRSQKIPDWLGSHQRMFAAWGGTPRTVIPDNLKSGVIRASNRGEPEIQQQYAEMGTHYGFNIVPTRPAHPKDKAKVEQTVQYITRQVLFVLRHRNFYSLDGLNLAIRAVVDQLNQRPIRRLKRSRLELFNSGESAALRKLPRIPWEFAEYHQLTVGTDYHVEFERHSYSVPFTLLGEEVEVRVTRGCVDIYHRGTLVAAHLRSHGFGRTTDRAHVAPNHRAYFEWQSDEALREAHLIGRSVQKFLELLFEQSSSIPHQHRAWQSLQKMKEEFGPDRLKKACSQALEAGANNTSFVRNLLRNKLEAFQPPDTGEPAVREHENLRRSKEFDLSERGRGDDDQRDSRKTA